MHRSAPSTIRPTVGSGTDKPHKLGFENNEASHTQSRKDNIDDASSVQRNIAQAYVTLEKFYKENKSAIDMAGNALISRDYSDDKHIENTVTTFTGTSNVIIEGLEMLSKIHPFIGVVLIPFKVLIKLDTTRRKNGRKLCVIKFQIQELICTFFELRPRPDIQHMPSNGHTLPDSLSSKMEAMAEDVAADIEACCSACTEYMDRSFAVQVLKSNAYEKVFANYGARFAYYKQQIQFVLVKHMAQGTDRMQSMDKKLDDLPIVVEQRLLELLRKFAAPPEKEAQQIIDNNGGAEACLDNEEVLQIILVTGGEHLPSLDSARLNKQLKEEFAEDVVKVFSKTETVFQAKMEMQQRYIKEMFEGGAHQEIIDNDLQEIWRVQGWKGSVKALRFVLALNDHYAKKLKGSFTASDQLALNTPTPSDTGDHEAQLAATDDGWALAYINAAHLQHILEAVDDDGSSFVSIEEANIFATSRPQGWSLPSWVAFWAAGWQVSITWYKDQIYGILSAMVDLARSIKTANAQAANAYLNGPEIRKVELLLRSTQSAPTTYRGAHLGTLIKKFQEEEEETLSGRLHSLRYELYDIDTVLGVTGPGRIDRYIYPMIYLLLKRHYDVMRLARIHILDEQEWGVMRASLVTIFEVVDQRIQNIVAISRATSSDVKDRLSHFAFGMFELLYTKPNERDRKNNTICSFGMKSGYHDWSDADSEPNKTNTAILRYPTQNTFTGVYDLEKREPLSAPLLDKLDGEWTGQIQISKDGEVTAEEGTITMILARAGDTLSGAAEHFDEILEVAGTVNGDKVDFKMFWKNRYYAVRCTGEYDPQRDIIVGQWREANFFDDDGFYSHDNFPDHGFYSHDNFDDDDLCSHDSDDTICPFVFCRTPATVYRYRYTEAQFAAHRSRARWGFAIAAVIAELHRQKFSPTYAKERSAERKRYMELEARKFAYERCLTLWRDPTDEENGELNRLRATLRPCDSRFYGLAVRFQLQKIVAFEKYCASCNREIRGTRFFCLQCIRPQYENQIDLCLDCVQQTAETGEFVHKRSHVLVKTRRYIHDGLGEIAQIVPVAQAVVVQVKGSLTSDPQLSRWCASCYEDVFCPFWVCITCYLKEPYRYQYTYICVDCEAKGSPAPTIPQPIPESIRDAGPNAALFISRPLYRRRSSHRASATHQTDHLLLQILDGKPIPKQMTADMRLSEVETKVQMLHSKMHRVEGKVDQLLALLGGKVANQTVDEEAM